MANLNGRHTLRRWLACAAMAVGVSSWAVPAASAQDVDAAQAIRAGLRLTQFTIADVAIPQGRPDEVQIPVRLGDRNVDLILRPYSMRSPDFRVLEVREGGALVEVPVEAPATYRGVCPQDPDTLVRASIRDGQITAMVQFPDGSRYGIQPMNEFVPDAEASLHVVYAARDVIPGDTSCGVIDAPVVGSSVDEPEQGTRGTGLKVSDVGLEADFQYYQLLGSNTQTVINDIELVMNANEAIYENDIQVTYEITTIIVWTVADPYTDPDGGDFLNQVRSYWQGNFQGVRRDQQQTFTGIDITGSTIGIAFLSSVCDPQNHYSIVQSRWTSNFTLRMCVTAHEFGHQWSAQHCDGQSNCAIMCSGAGGCTGNCTTFGFNIPGMISYKNGRNCLSDLADPRGLPFTDNFEIATLDAAKWSYIFGVSTTVSPIPAPSGARVLRLNSAGAGDFFDDELRSNFLLGSGAPVIQVRFYVAKRAVEAGKQFFVDYWASTLRWNEVMALTSDGVDDSEYTLYTLNLPGDAAHNELRIRFRVDGSQLDDEWFVDDLRVGEPIEDAIALPFSEQFPTLVADPAKWSIFQGTINTLAVNEPSPPNSVELDGSFADEFIRTKPLLAGGASEVTVSYQTQHRGVESGETLIVEAQDNAGVWVILNEVVSTGVDQSVFVPWTHTLTGNFLYDGLRLRWRENVNNSNDNWYVDDVLIEAPDECRTDWNGDGVTNSADVSVFLNDWFLDQANGTTVADWTEDGVSNAVDVSEFFNAYFAAPLDCLI